MAKDSEIYTLTPKGYAASGEMQMLAALRNLPEVSDSIFREVSSKVTDDMVDKWMHWCKRKKVTLTSEAAQRRFHQIYLGQE